MRRQRAFRAGLALLLMLRAPSDAVVLSRVREPGSIVRSGEPVFTLALERPVWVRAYVSEADLGRVAPGTPAQVFTDTAPDRPYAAQVGFVSPVAEFTPRSVETPDLRSDLVYQIRVIVARPDGGLRQGMPFRSARPRQGFQLRTRSSRRGALCRLSTYAPPLHPVPRSAGAPTCRPVGTGSPVRRASHYGAFRMGPQTKPKHPRWHAQGRRIWSCRRHRLARAGCRAGTGIAMAGCTLRPYARLGVRTTFAGCSELDPADQWPFSASNGRSDRASRSPKAGVGSWLSVPRADSAGPPPAGLASRTRTASPGRLAYAGPKTLLVQRLLP